MKRLDPKRAGVLGLLLILAVAVAVLISLSRRHPAESANQAVPGPGPVGDCAQPKPLMPAVQSSPPAAEAPRCFSPAPANGIYRLGPASMKSSAPEQIAVIDGCVGVSGCSGALVWQAGVLECPLGASGNPGWTLRVQADQGGKLAFSLEPSGGKKQEATRSPEVPIPEPAAALARDPRPEVAAAAIESVARSQDDGASCQSLGAAIEAASHSDLPNDPLGPRVFALATAPCLLPALASVAAHGENLFVAIAAARAIAHLRAPPEERVHALRQVVDGSTGDLSPQVREIVITLDAQALDAAWASLGETFRSRPGWRAAIALNAVAIRAPSHLDELFRIAEQTQDCSVRRALLADWNDDLKRHLDEPDPGSLARAFRDLVLVEGEPGSESDACERSREVAGEYFARLLHLERRSTNAAVLEAWRLALDAVRSEKRGAIRQQLVAELGRCGCLLGPTGDADLASQLARELSLQPCGE